MIFSNGAFDRGIFKPLLCWQMLAVIVFQSAYKLFIRHSGFVKDAAVEDKKLWARETYWSAFCHNTICGILWLACILKFVRPQFRLSGKEPTDFSEWFEGPFASWEEMPAERLVLGVNIGEMITDCVLYSHYRGFARSYWIHHLMTLFASVAASVINVPAGAAASFGCWMEMGSIPLNFCSLYPSAAAFRCRAIGYAFSRIVASCILVMISRLTYFYPEKCSLAAVIWLWPLMFVNLKWVKAICMTQLKFEMSRNEEQEISSSILR